MLNASYVMLRLSLVRSIGRYICTPHFFEFLEILNTPLSYKWLRILAVLGIFMTLYALVRDTYL